MAREKGRGNLQKEKSGRYTLRVGINGRRYSRSTGTTDREKAERALINKDHAAACWMNVKNGIVSAENGNA